MGCLSSRSLIQHLLLRFGIRGRLRFDLCFVVFGLDCCRLYAAWLDVREGTFRLDTYCYFYLLLLYLLTLLLLLGARWGVVGAGEPVLGPDRPRGPWDVVLCYYPVEVR